MRQQIAQHVSQQAGVGLHVPVQKAIAAHLKI
jgi:hypothetical protein